MHIRLIRSRHLGLALSAERMVAAIPAPHGGPEPRTWTQPLAAHGRGSPDPDELCAALAALRQAWGGGSGVLHVALLPPLVRTAELELPPLRPAEERRVLSRNAGRYVLGVREPQVVAAVPLAQGKGRNRLVAAAPVRWVEALHTAAVAAGWELGSVSAAHAAWCAAHTLWPGLRPGGFLAVLLDEHVEVLRLARGACAGAIQLPAAGAEPRRIAELLGELVSAETQRAAPALAVVGAEPLLEHTVRELGSAGIPLLPAPDTSPPAHDPAVLAARFAPRTRRLELVPDGEYDRRQARRRRTTAALLGVALASLLAAAGLELWGVHRELAAVRRERGAIHANVEAVLRVRQAVEEVGGRLDTIEELERSTPRWSGVVAEVARRLPRDAYLAAFRGHADSLVLEGSAQRVTGVFAALRSARGLTEVRSGAPVEQRFDEGSGDRARFVLAARVAGAPAAAGGEP